MVIEYKFVGKSNGKGSYVLDDTVDGKQGSLGWILGSKRLRKAVGEHHAKAIEFSIEKSRIETWVVTTKPDGSSLIEVLDALGKTKKVDTSKILIKDFIGGGARP